MAANYPDVLAQLQAYGLLVADLEIGRMRRCRVEGGGKEKRGWYSLHSIVGKSGDLLIVGTFGIWRGNDANAQKIELKREAVSPEQLEAIRRKMREDQRKAKAQREREKAQAGDKARKAWAALQPDGESDYLVAKGVSGHGLRYTKNGRAVLPLLDDVGIVHGLQILRTAKQAEEDKRPAKQFWPAGLGKKGRFFLIGGIPSRVLLMCEGYATGASLYEATGLPVAVCFDANNLMACAPILRKRYPSTKMLVCADDDCWTDDNPGVSAASAAALDVAGAWIKPEFADEDARQRKRDTQGHKLTDFNDLHATDGLQAVRRQVEERLKQLGWRTADPARAADPAANGGGGEAPLGIIASLEELLDRYSLVYGQDGQVFDHQEHILVGVSDMREICLTRQLHRAWSEHPDRHVVRLKNVGFDPAGEDANITCNLWSGWPTIPRAGECGLILDMLRYLCSRDDDPEELFDWVLKWIAYPLQNPGAKMKSAIVMHGGQGAGKSQFFEALMRAYGHYGGVIDQTAIEDKFNDWASKKLFLIADEVVARSDLYHVKNKLKSLITGDWIRINPKNRGAWDERNHVNLVFLSNEVIPTVIEEDDRRHCVVWTPEKLDKPFYERVVHQIHNGGIEALHHHLLSIPLDGFSTATEPPMTRAKRNLINASMDSTSRFWHEWSAGEIPDLPMLPALSEDLYSAYRHWTLLQGSKPAASNRLVDVLRMKHRCDKARKRYVTEFGSVSKHPSTIVFPPGAEPPPGMPETAWLGDCIQKFRAGLTHWKGVQP